MKTVRPDPRLVLDLFKTEAADRLQIPADVGRHALGGFKRLKIEHHRQRLDDCRLALLSSAQLLLRLETLGIGSKIGIEQRLLVARLALNLPRFFEYLHQ